MCASKTKPPVCVLRLATKREFANEKTRVWRLSEKISARCQGQQRKHRHEMGGYSAKWRRFFYKLFTGCFFAEIAPRSFDVVIYDSMEILAMCQMTPNRQNTYSCGQSLINFAEGYLTTGEEGIVAASTMVLLLDNFYCTPRTKSAEEEARDSRKGTWGTKKPVECNDDDGDKEKEQWQPSAEMLSSLSEKEFVNLFGANGGSDDFLFPEGPFPSDGVKMWRSSILRWNMWHHVTRHLSSTKVPEGKMLVIDDALPINKSEYLELRYAVTHDFGLEESSEFVKQCHIAAEMRGYMQRLIVEHGGKFTRKPSLGVGESDLKVCQYISKNRGAKSFLVRCQDTDLLSLLALLVKMLIDKDTGNVEVELWLDTKSMSCESKPYRYVNVVALWRAIIAYFNEEFPAVKNPVETLVFLVYCLKSDYVDKFHSHLGIGTAMLWNTFAALHHCRPSTLGYHQYFGEHKALNLPLVRKRESAVCKRMRGVLNDALLLNVGTVEQDSVCEVVLNEEAMSKFFYYMCEKVVNYRDDTFNERLEKRSIVNNGQPASSAWSLLARAEKLVGEIRFRKGTIDMKVEAVPRAGTPLYTLLMKEVPDRFGIIGEGEMYARLARLRWIMNYLQNPTWTTHAGSWFAATGNLSKWGWKLTPVPNDGCGVYENSLYIYAEHSEDKHTKKPRLAFYVASQSNKVVNSEFVEMFESRL